jgi:cellulose synthase/poly-beta-1,6-N-acetylglucosamine synthase-like glycosyltransferase
MNPHQPCISSRAHINGKFIVIGDSKFHIKGVTYGTFEPDENEYNFPSADVIKKDFSMMVQHGINTVRTYTVPPLHLLDIADQFDLKVMVGLPWEQHITFLDTNEGINQIIRRTQEGVRHCQSHSAILCYAIGNEIPAPIVRWYGPKRIEQFLKKLYLSVKEVDPAGLVTYVNYPTTEYLNLPFLDFVCFNVYLETEEKLKGYLARLNNLSQDKPLVLAEIGLDSLRNGAERQAETLDWQIRTIFGSGLAGIFVFAWTDEWWRGGSTIEDWDFGLVTRERQPKPALYTVARAFEQIPFAPTNAWPFISVVVCSYNGASTIRDTMEGLLKVDYPSYEVIVVDDGSTDKTAAIVSEYPFTLLSTRNQGLSCARNTGLHRASGDIVAYIDDDAYPDPHWLKYLAYAYHNSSHVGIGGPNLAPPGDGPIADCVANAPGGPVHVLIDDEVAEHIPGCNMSFRRDALLAIGGFDPVYRAAGDDVDVCWRIQNNGGTIGYHPSALVWHHRRNSIRMYWKQQRGYGKAEALLEKKWPEKYNRLGHLSWSGQIYGNGLTHPIKLNKDKVFYGTWGTALFQSVYQQAPHFTAFIPLMPEWYFVILLLFVLSIFGLIWQPLLWALPLLLFTGSIVVIQAGFSATKARFTNKPQTPVHLFKYWSLTTLLHLMQPVSRLYGRLKHGLTPWRKRGSDWSEIKSLFLTDSVQAHWSETWNAPETWLTDVEKNLISAGNRVRRGGVYDNWDLQVSYGFFAHARGILTVEEHGGGKQYVKFKSWNEYSVITLLFIVTLTAISVLAAINDVQAIALGFGALAMLLFYKLFMDCVRSLGNLKNAFSQLDGPVAARVSRQIQEANAIPYLQDITMSMSTNS